MSGPSDKAVEAARGNPDFELGRRDEDVTREVLDLAHDPALGLDRSVCLRDVVEALLEWPDGKKPPTTFARGAAAFIEREFTEESSEPNG